MKKLLFNTMALMALFALMSNACDDLKDKFEINVPLDIEETIWIEANQSGVVTKVIETKVNEDISKYLGEIESLTLSKISYEIVALDGHGESTSMSLKLGYSALSSSTSIEILNEENVFSSFNTEIEMDLSEAQLNAIADLFRKDGQLKVYLDGSSTGVVDANVILRFEGSFNALD